MTPNVVINLITISILFAFSIYHFLLYFGRRKIITEKYNLYFSLFTFSIILFILFTFPKGSLISKFIQNYPYDINPPIAFFIDILMLFFFVKILIELLKPSKLFNIIKRILFSCLFIIDLLSFLSIIYGYDWYVQKIDFYLTISVSAISLTFIILFIYNTSIKKRYKDPVIFTFLMAFFIIGIYLIITAIILTKYPSLQANNNYGFVAIYIIFLAFSLSLKSNNEFNELIKFKNDLEKKVAERTRQIEILAEEKTNFLINIAHETKTPLTLVSNYLEKYIEKNKNDEDLIIIKNNIDKMRKDIVNYFDMEKLLSGIDFYDNEKITCISAVLDEKIKLFKKSIESKSILINAFIKKELYIKLDPFALDRIINNLIENAVKFSQNNGEITIELNELANTVIFKVQDNGIGIESEKLNFIWKPFFQIQHQKRNIQGMGLGLSIVKKIIDSINAEIKVESILNQGTCFTIVFNKYIPAKNDEIDKIVLSKPFPIIEARIKDDCFIPGKYNILIVEDNIELINFLHDNISKKYNCFLALNGTSALKKLSSIPKPHLILSDIMMDDMDGFSFYDELQKKEKYNSIPFIFLTAKTKIENKYTGLRKGAVDYITKPFLIYEVILKIDSIIKNYSLQIETIKNNIIKSINNYETGKEIMPKNDIQDFNSICKTYSLTAKDKEIIILLIKGYEYKEIAGQLNSSFNTIKKNIQMIYKKCNVDNKIKLINLFN